MEKFIEHWNSATKKRKCATDPTDYHDSDKFEKWFTNLCVTLKKKHGPCNIHMDGASYHKRITNPSLTKKWLKADITAWLTDHGTSLFCTNNVNVVINYDIVVFC